MSSVSITLASKPENGHNVVSFVDSFARRNKLDDDLRDKLMLLISELATNGMEHGNGYDESKNVRIAIHLLPEKVEVEVEDEGEGFSPVDVPDPLAEENLLGTSGRGIFLIEALSDEVRYENGGRLIHVTVNRTSAD